MSGRAALAAAVAVAVVAVAIVAAYLLAGRGRASYSVEVHVDTNAIGSDGFFKVKYTCDGADVSPPLRITVEGKSVANVRSLAIVMVDPDAPGGLFVHWLLYNIPVSPSPGTITIYIPEGLPHKPMVEGVGVQGVNSFGWIGYGGPCPPRGDKPHHYVIRVYALDKMLDLPAGISYDELMRAIRGHVIGVGEVVGLYKR